MSKNSIYSKIEENGRLEVEEILNEASSKANSLYESIIDDANKNNQIILDNALAKNKESLKSKVTSAEQSSNQEILAHKKQLIHQVFHQVLESLINLNNQEYKEFVLKTIKNNEITGNEIIKVSKNEFEKFKSIFSNSTLVNGFYDLNVLNKLLDNKFELVLSNEQMDISGGFIIEGTSFDIDNSYESIISELEENMEKEIASILFADEG